MEIRLNSSKQPQAPTWQGLRMASPSSSLFVTSGRLGKAHENLRRGLVGHLVTAVEPERQRYT